MDFLGAVVDASVLGVGGDVVSGAPFVDGLGCFACGFGDFLGCGVVGQVGPVWLGWVESCGEFGFEVVEFLL